MFYQLIGYKHFPEYYFKFVRFWVIIYQKIDLKLRVHSDVPVIESPRLLFVEQTRKRLLGWIADIAASQVADRKGSAYIVEEIVKKLLCFLLLSLLFNFGITKH